MAKLMIMRKSVKARYAADGRDRCTSCRSEIKVGDEYTTTSKRCNGKRRLLYCRACAEEKGIL